MSGHPRKSLGLILMGSIYLVFVGGGFIKFLCVCSDRVNHHRAAVISEGGGGKGGTRPSPSVPPLPLLGPTRIIPM